MIVDIGKTRAHWNSGTVHIQCLGNSMKENDILTLFYKCQGNPPSIFAFFIEGTIKTVKLERKVTVSTFVVTFSSPVVCLCHIYGLVRQMSSVLGESR